MPRPLEHARRDFLESAADLVAAGGARRATTAAITARLGATVGSFYHQFTSRDALLAQLWLERAAAFQREFLALLADGDPAAAALFTPRWVRAHPRDARILLLHRQEDFEDGRWPERDRRRAARLHAELGAGLRAACRRLLGSTSADALRRVRFALVDVPLAAVRRPLAAGEPVPPSADTLVRECCLALLGPAGARRSA